MKKEVVMLRTLMFGLGATTLCMAILICYSACIAASRSEKELEEIFENDSEIGDDSS